MPSILDTVLTVLAAVLILWGVIGILLSFPTGVYGEHRVEREVSPSMLFVGMIVAVLVLWMISR